MPLRIENQSNFDADEGNPLQETTFHPTIRHDDAAASGKRRELGRIRAVVLLILLGVMGITLARVEMLNGPAGCILPRSDDTGGRGLSKWRRSPFTTEERWRELAGPRDADGNPVPRPLNDAERTQMLRDIERSIANNQLRDLISTWGVAQYALAPTAFLISLSLMGSKYGRNRCRWLGGIGLLLSSVAGGIAFYRGYFTSLGM